MIVNPVTQRVHLTLEEKAAYAFGWNTKPDSPIPFFEQIRNYRGGDIERIVKDGAIEFETLKYLISWISGPVMCKNASQVYLKFRRPGLGVKDYPRVLIMAGKLENKDSKVYE